MVQIIINQDATLRDDLEAFRFIHSVPVEVFRNHIDEAGVLR